MSEEFGRPIGTDGGAKFPGFGRAVRANPWVITFPFSFGVPNKTVGPLVENVIGNGDFAGDIFAVRTVIAHNPDAVGMGDVAQVAGELRSVVAAVKQDV